MKVRIIAGVLLLLSVLQPAMGQTKDQKNRKAKLEKEIAILDQQIRSTNKKSDNALSSLRLTRRKIDSRKQLIAESDREIAELDGRISAQNDTIAMLQNRLDTMSLYYSRLVKTAYRNRDPRIWFMSLLSSGDLGQGLRRYGYLKSLSGQMNTQARQIEDMRDTLQARKAAVETLRAEAGSVREARREDLSKLQKEEGESQALVNKLKKDKASYQKQLKAKQRQMEALNREIQKMIEEATRASQPSKGKGKGSATASASKPRTEADIKLEAQFAANKGKLPWPAEGPVVEGFGRHNHPVYTNVQMPFNNGVNIALPPNTAVKAVFGGTVSKVIVMPGYNQCVLIQHGGYFTFYCKLASVNVKAGDKVSTGQVIGRVDTISDETQLHFELWEGKNPRDPESWLR